MTEFGLSDMMDQANLIHNVLTVEQASGPGGNPKWVHSWNGELDSERTIVEAGMQRPKVKAADFVGKEAYLAQREAAPATVLCTLTVDDHTSASGTKRYMLGGEPILTRDGGTLTDGQKIILAGEPPLEVTVVHTPGHARGHLCFLEEAGRSVVAGDLIAGLGTIVIDPPEGDMDDYLGSLAKLAALRPVLQQPPRERPTPPVVRPARSRPCPARSCPPVTPAACSSRSADFYRTC